MLHDWLISDKHGYRAGHGPGLGRLQLELEDLAERVYANLIAYYRRERERHTEMMVNTFQSEIGLKWDIIGRDKPCLYKHLRN